MAFALRAGIVALALAASACGGPGGGGGGGGGGPLPGSVPPPGTPLVINTTAGTPGTAIVTVSETGSADLTVTPGVGPEPEFQVSGGFTIPDGGNPVDVTVTCTSAVPGTFTTTLSIVHNGQNVPSPAQHGVTCNVAAASEPGYGSAPPPGTPLTINTTVGVGGTATVTVSETGTETLIGTSAIVAAPEFQLLAGAAFNIPDGGAPVDHQPAGHAEAEAEGDRPGLEQQELAPAAGAGDLLPRQRGLQLARRDPLEEPVVGCEDLHDPPPDGALGQPPVDGRRLQELEWVVPAQLRVLERGAGLVGRAPAGHLDHLAELFQVHRPAHHAVAIGGDRGVQGSERGHGGGGED